MTDLNPKYEKKFYFHHLIPPDYLARFLPVSCHIKAFHPHFRYALYKVFAKEWDMTPRRRHKYTLLLWKRRLWIKLTK